MPLLYPEAIEDVRLGTQMVGALMVGTDEIYVRFERYFYDKPGDFSLTLPDWATAYGAVLSGAGGGGRAGNGAVNDIGHGGRGGKLEGIWGRLTTPDSDREIGGFIGTGGLGGVNSHANGQNGGNTSFSTHTGTIYIAEGGTAYPSSGRQDGSRTEVTFSETFSKYINHNPSSFYSNGPAGTGNGGSGKHGGGGAGGNGGVLNRYTQGGKGGDGFVEIYVWGLPRH